MNIIFFEVENWEQDLLRKKCDAVGMVATFVTEPLHLGNVGQYIGATIISCRVNSYMKAPLLEKIPSLKMIATRSTGFDHIDLAYCNAKEIPVENVPTYGAHTVAEHAFALLLAVSRHIPHAVEKTRAGDFSLADLQGFDLYGKTLGIIGLGSIGQCVAQIAKGFGMSILVYDIQPDQALDLAYVSMDAVLQASDIISLHVPSTPATRNLLSDKEFSLMKEGVVIINTARGVVMDVKALLRALESGKVRAAGLDVLPDELALREEPQLLCANQAGTHDLEILLADHALINHKNVIITPHSGFLTTEAVNKILDTTLENILSFLCEKRQNVVNNPQISG